MACFKEMYRNCEKIPLIYKLNLNCILKQNPYDKNILNSFTNVNQDDFDSKTLFCCSTYVYLFNVIRS